VPAAYSNEVIAYAPYRSSKIFNPVARSCFEVRGSNFARPLRNVCGTESQVNSRAD
jgi:hypothetical protein